MAFNAWFRRGWDQGTVHGAVMLDAVQWALMTLGVGYCPETYVANALVAHTVTDGLMLRIRWKPTTSQRFFGMGGMGYGPIHQKIRKNPAEVARSAMERGEESHPGVHKGWQAGFSLAFVYTPDYDSSEVCDCAESIGLPRVPDVATKYRFRPLAPTARHLASRS